MKTSDLYSDIDFICQTGSDVESYKNADKLRNMNRWYHKVQDIIIDSMGSWIFKGNWACDDLIKNQEEYIFPSNILTINRVEVRYDTGDNDWVRAKNVPLEQVQYILSNTTDKIGSKVSPIYWLPDTLSMVLRPIPDKDITEGIRIWYTRDITELINDTDEPEFAEPFHRILSLGASLDYVIANQILEKRNTIKSELNEMIDRLTIFYSKRNRISKARILPRITNYQ
jgi:hypothetical protein